MCASSSFCRIVSLWESDLCRSNRGHQLFDVLSVGLGFTLIESIHQFSSVVYCAVFRGLGLLVIHENIRCICVDSDIESRIVQFYQGFLFRVCWGDNVLQLRQVVMSSVVFTQFIALNYDIWHPSLQALFFNYVRHIQCQCGNVLQLSAILMFECTYWWLKLELDCGAQRLERTGQLRNLQSCNWLF